MTTPTQRSRKEAEAIVRQWQRTILTTCELTDAIATALDRAREEERQKVVAAIMDEMDASGPMASEHLLAWLAPHSQNEEDGDASEQQTTND